MKIIGSECRRTISAVSVLIGTLMVAGAVGIGSAQELPAHRRPAAGSPSFRRTNRSRRSTASCAVSIENRDGYLSFL